MEVGGLIAKAHAVKLAGLRISLEIVSGLSGASVSHAQVFSGQGDFYGKGENKQIGNDQNDEKA
jgi:hypothetical protein